MLIAITEWYNLTSRSLPLSLLDSMLNPEDRSFVNLSGEGATPSQIASSSSFPEPCTSDWPSCSPAGLAHKSSTSSLPTCIGNRLLFMTVSYADLACHGRDAHYVIIRVENVWHLSLSHTHTRTLSPSIFAFIPLFFLSTLLAPSQSYPTLRLCTTPLPPSTHPSPTTQQTSVKTIITPKNSRLVNEFLSPLPSACLTC
jgi:hypothetical protein